MSDVINDMLNEASKDMRYKKIFIYDIDPCEYNQYPMQEIEQLARNISEAGLLHPIMLYKKNDGRYMILSGERRYRAMLLNYENGDERFEEIPAIIKLQVLDERTIKRYIRRGNANRENLSKEVKLAIVKESLEDYQISKERNEIESGVLKRDWIAMDTGFSARSVQDYLNLLSIESSDKSKKQKQDSSKYKELQQSLVNLFHSPVKVSDKQISIRIKNEEDLQRILEIIGLED